MDEKSTAESTVELVVQQLAAFKVFNCFASQVFFLVIQSCTHFGLMNGETSGRWTGERFLTDNVYVALNVCIGLQLSMNYDIFSGRNGTGGSGPLNVLSFE